MLRTMSHFYAPFVIVPFCSVERRAFVRKFLLELIVTVFKRAEQPSIDNLFKAMSSFAVRGDAVSPSSLLPTDLQKDAQEAVRQMVIDRAATNTFFASVAWSWFGLFSEELLRKHGFAIYFNAHLEGNHYGVDGFTNLVLAGSDRYSRIESFPQEFGIAALAVIGRIGFTGPPLDRTKFSRAFIDSGAPLPVWASLLKQYKKTPEALAGVFFVFLLVNALGVREMEGVKDPEALQQSIKSSVLNSRSIRKLEFYPQILRMATSSVFESERR